MFSSLGLHDWELIAASGLCAVAMLAVSALIGALTAYVALHEAAPSAALPKVMAEPAVREPVAPAMAREPALAG